MSDSEEEQQEFEQATSGAAGMYPKQAGNIKKGDHVVIKDRPCKVVDYSTSKTGKHGHAKAKIVAIDIFTGNKYEDVAPTSHNLMCPDITRTEYTLVDINDEGYMTLMDENGELREDLKQPEEDSEYYNLIKKYRDEGKDSVMVTVVGALGIEGVCGVKAE